MINTRLQYMKFFLCRKGFLAAEKKFHATFYKKNEGSPLQTALVLFYCISYRISKIDPERATLLPSRAIPSR